MKIRERNKESIYKIPDRIIIYKIKQIMNTRELVQGYTLAAIWRTYEI